MDQASQGTAEYRILLVEPHLRKLLAIDSAGCNRLPCVRIPRSARRVDALRKAIYAAWGLSVFIIDFLGDDGPAPCVVAEVETATTSPNLKKVSLQQIPDAELPEMQREAVEILLDGCSKDEISRIGWIKEAVAWVEAKTHRTIQTESDIEQFSAGTGFALLRFRTDDGSKYWLKAASDLHQHEPAVTALLSKLAGEYLPDFIALKPEWNAWLMSGEGTAISELTQHSFDLFRLLDNAVESMAELQIRTIGHTAALRSCGAFDQDVQILAACSIQLFDYLEEAMSLQASTRVPRVAKERLREVRRVFDAVCDRLAELDLPGTVIHGDINAGNIVVRAGSCRFIDWSEAYLGNPLITLQHLLLLNHIDPPELKAVMDRALIESYQTVLEKACNRALIDEALAYMPLLAAVSALYGRGDWLKESSLRASRNHAYARSLARHMERAIRDPKFLYAISTQSRLGNRTLVSVADLKRPEGASHVDCARGTL